MIDHPPRISTPADEPAAGPATGTAASEEKSADPFEQTGPVIAKPDQDLEPTPAVEPPSIFDSVRIVDSFSQPTPGDIPTDLKPIEPAEAPGPNGSGNEGERGYTAPNIGQVDTDGRKGAKLKPLEEGSILNGRYEIIRKIGGGGMGAVYLASDNNLGGVLRAVKEMVQSHIEEEQQVKAIEDFRRESMILSQLDHPSIPTIYDYFYDETEGRFYLVMKYISGGDLAARLRATPEGKIDELTVTKWGIQIADVLDYLHNQPATIVYRDLKPSNVMLDGNSGRVVLIDFGIARSINQIQEKGVTAVGTMGYAPPELFSGNVEPRSDIYSLGSTMFHLMTGADPQSNPLLIFDFQKNPRPRQINSQLSDQIERILMKCVEYNADARFTSAAEVKAVLAEHYDNLKKGLVTYGVKAAPEAVSLANQTVFCGFCGQKIVATDLFCAFCGAKQPIAQQGVHSEVYKGGHATAKLVVEGTSDLHAPIFPLEKGEILIGRRDPMSNIFPEVDLSKYDPQTKISRRHARIWREGHTYLLEDLGSSNGTMLMPIVHEAVKLGPRQPHALTNGDRIRVGDTTLHFVIG
ncbi:MAG: protein kinase domain-containing protein [Pyrinomonadaceae bacterium]